MSLVSKSPVSRKIIDRSVKIASYAAALLGITFLAWILAVVIQRGLGAINIDFFLSSPAPPGEGSSGLSTAIAGTVIITLLAVFLGVPTGILTGIFVSEVADKTPAAKVIRFSVNILTGVPSIIMGLFVYTVIVLPMGEFSGFAGAVSLGIIMLPIVAGVTDNMLTLVPDGLRESAMALGMPAWRITIGIVLKSARTGIITGTMLAIARVAGESAPLLFTALNSVYMPDNLFKPVSNLTVTIFNYAMSPYKEWQQMAWGASLLITVCVLGTTIFTRIILKEKKI